MLGGENSEILVVHRNECQLCPHGSLCMQALLGADCQALRVTLGEMTDNMLGLYGLVRRLNELVSGANRREGKEREILGGQ